MQAEAHQEPAKTILIDWIGFVPWESIKVFERQVDRAFGHPDKRTRQAAFRALVRAIKALELTPPNWEIKGLSFGCLGATGERGLFIIYQIHSQVRNLSVPGNYAEERKR